MHSGATREERNRAGRIFVDPHAYVDERRWHAAARVLREHSAVHRVADIELDGEPAYTLATFVGGPKRLPIRYRARA